jgi:hypothetical protein
VQQELHHFRRAGHGLVLLIAARRQEVALQALAGSLALPYLNVGLELSRRLLDVPVPRRAARASRELSVVFGAVRGEVVAGGLGLLFLPELRLDPLRALELHARSRLIFAEWVGTFVGDVLTYAEPGHTEHRYWEGPGCSTIEWQGKWS